MTSEAALYWYYGTTDYDKRMHTLQVVFDHGRYARRRNGIGVNPHPPGTPDRTQWFRGYDAEDRIQKGANK